MSNSEFLEAYEGIVKKSAAKLRDNSFACFVVGDYRDKGGYLVDLGNQTVRSFEKAGARPYNSAFLRTPTGSSGKRAERIFGTNRKLIAVHQNVLVFCKGDWKKAAAKSRAPGRSGVN